MSGRDGSEGERGNEKLSQMGEGTQPSGLMCTLTPMCGGVKLPHRFHFSRGVHIAEQLPMASVKVHGEMGVRGREGMRSYHRWGRALSHQG